MRIARAIGVRMMYAVSHHPLNGTTFESQGAAGNEKVFNQFRYFVTAMGKQPMIAHADTKTAANPVKNYSGDYSRPAPKEQCCDGAKMSANEENSGSPIASDPIDVRPLVRRCDVPTFV
jgi:hypothetical protein